MKLERAEIRNFRSIKEATIEFNPPCRALVGMNESGKSNILKALRLLDREYTPSKNDRRTVNKGEKALKFDGSNSYVAFIFSLDEKESQKLQKVVNSKISNFGIGHRYIGRSGNNFVTSDWLLSRPSEIEYRVNLQTEERHYSHRFTQSEKFKFLGPNEERISPDDFYRILSESLEEVLPEYLPKVLFWNYKGGDILPEKVNIQSFRDAPDSYPLLKNMFLLHGVKEHQIGVFIDDAMSSGSTSLENSLEDIADAATAHFKRVWVERKDENIQFSLRPYSDTEIILSIKEGRAYKFEQRSDGFKRFVFFLLTLSLQTEAGELKNALLLIDEPSMGLHPSSEKNLLDELIKISNENFLVYSTHSIFMIDLKEIKRHYIVKRDREITRIMEVQNSKFLDEDVLYKALGFSVLDILKSQNIIFEGWRDKRIFQLVIEKNTSDELKQKYKEIGYCHADGAHGIKVVSAVLELVKRQCLIVSDCDADGQKAKKEYTKNKGYGDWRTYKDIDMDIKAITGEDFINDDHIIEAVKRTLPDGSPEFDTEKLPDEDKLKAIMKWIEKNKVDVKKGDIKGAIFKDIKYENIDIDKYQKLLDGITNLVFS